MRTRTPLTATLVTALLLAGCAQEPRKTTSDPTLAPIPSVTGTSPPLVTPEAAATPADPYRSPTSLVPAEADAQAEQGAIDAAVRAAGAYVQGKALVQKTWNAQLLETLAPIARPAYDNTLWGYQIEPTTLTGDTTVVEATMLTAVVEIPTDANTLTITVSRDGDAAAAGHPISRSQWMATAIEEVSR